LDFYGGHPISGKEVSGFENASPDLMKGAYHILLNNKNLKKTKLLQELHQSIGMKVIFMDAEEHDLTFGLVSHLPHLMVYSLVELIAEVKIDALDYTGGGFRDFTRIAASDPKMWSQIFVSNKDVMLNILYQYEKVINEWKNFIENEDIDGMFNKIKKVKAIKLNIND
jgi:prephenate dehydrogenase